MNHRGTYDFDSWNQNQFSSFQKNNKTNRTKLYSSCRTPIYWAIALLFIQPLTNIANVQQTMNGPCVGIEWAVGHEWALNGPLMGHEWAKNGPCMNEP